MDLNLILLKKIKTEVATDPEKIGYAGKTNAQIVALLTGAVVTTSIQIITSTTASPLSRIWAGIPDTPNIITLVDLQAALAIT